MDFSIKYRPKKWSEVSGHNNIIKLLKTTDNWQTLLFFGPPGTGKTTLARILAMHMNCENADLETCNLSCNSCIAINSGVATDYLEVNVADKRGIDEMRDVVDWLKYKPMSLRRKVLVLDEVHMLTTYAQNMLLKALEEPPPSVSIILCTTDPNNLLESVRQRCLSYRLTPVSKNDLFNMFTRVIENEKISPESLDKTFEQKLIQLIDQSGGIPRKFIKGLEVILKGGSLTDDIDDIGDLKDLIDAIYKGDVINTISEVSNLLKRYSDDEIYNRLLGCFFARLKRSKAINSVYENMGLIKSLAQDEKLVCNANNKLLYQITSAAIFIRSIRKNTDIEG